MYLNNLEADISRIDEMFIVDLRRRLCTSRRMFLSIQFTKLLQIQFLAIVVTKPDLTINQVDIVCLHLLMHQTMCMYEYYGS